MANNALIEHLQSATARLSDAHNNSHELLIKFRESVKTEGAVTPSNSNLLAESVDQLITASARNLEALSIIQAALQHLISSNDVLTQKIIHR